MENLVKRLVEEYGGISKFARLLDVKYRTVTQWIYYQRIPLDQLAKLGTISSLYTTLYHTELPEPRRPRTTLPTLLRVKKGEVTLEDAATRLGLPLKNLHKMYEAHKEHLEALVTLFPKVERREMRLSEVARQLGYDRRRLHQTFADYGYDLEPRKAPEPQPDPASEEALAVIAGRKTLRSCPSWRTVHRRITAMLEPLSLMRIGGLPKVFREAIARECQGDGVGIVLNLLTHIIEMDLSYDHGGLKTINWRDASAYEMLPRVLNGEIALVEVAELRGGEPKVIERMFDMVLFPIGYTYEQVLKMSIEHQSMISEFVVMFHSPESHTRVSNHPALEDVQAWTQRRLQERK